MDLPAAVTAAVAAVNPWQQCSTAELQALVCGVLQLGCNATDPIAAAPNLHSVAHTAAVRSMLAVRPRTFSNPHLNSITPSVQCIKKATTPVLSMHHCNCCGCCCGPHLCSHCAAIPCHHPPAWTPTPPPHRTLWRSRTTPTLLTTSSRWRLCC